MSRNPRIRTGLIAGLASFALTVGLGANAALVPSDPSGPWWQAPVLIAVAIGNAVARTTVYGPEPDTERTLEMKRYAPEPLGVVLLNISQPPATTPPIADRETDVA